MPALACHGQGRVNLALFDFDGTITTRETFPGFLQRAVTPRRLVLGKLLLAPLIVGYRLGIVSGTLVRASIVKFAFRGVAEAAITDVGEAFANHVLPQLLRPQAMERIRWHQAQGDTVVVVSGGFDLVLSHWCTQHGLALICSQLESAGGVLTGRYLGAQCVGAEKCRRVREQYEVSGFARVYAYGDTIEDLAMLEMAHERTFRWQKAA